jgi:hypothetical protein
MPVWRRVLDGRLGLVVLAAVTLAVVSGTLALGRADDTLRATSYYPLDGDVPNPERGWFLPVDILRDRDFRGATAAQTTLLFSYVRLDAHRRERLPKWVLKNLGYGLDAVKDAHLKVVLRFTYNFGPAGPEAKDAPRRWILRHIAQLGPVLRAHSEVVAAVQAGFIGAWGEWHSSTHGLDRKRSAKREVLEAERDAFPGQLMVRYPADARALDLVSDDRTVGDDSLQGSIGIHQDCFLASEPDDRGTWGRDGSAVVADKALAADAGRYAVAGGETCDVSSRTTCETAVAEMEQMHFTFLNEEFDPDALAQLAACKDEITQLLGYRLQLRTAEWPGALSHTATRLRVRLSLRNVGFASPYSARRAWLVLKCGADVQRLALESDPRSWDPGEHQIDETLAIRRPAKSASACRLGLALPDEHPELAYDPAYAIRLASSTTWRDGINWLGSVRVID